VNVFKEKVKYNKVLWKELIMGVVEAFIWCSVLFLIVYGYNEEMIDLLQFMSDNVDKVWSLYFSILAIFIVIATMIKLGFFVLKIDVPEEAKATRTRTRTAAPRATKKTVKKRTTKK